MKKYLVIGLGILAVSIMYFFVCDRPSKQEKGDTSLLSQQGGKLGGSSSAEMKDNLEGEQSEEEAVRGPGKPAAPNTITFVVNGDRYTYPSLMSFRMVRISNDMSGYLCNFSQSLEGIDVNNPETYKHVVSVLLPADVKATVYTQDNEKFVFEFFGSETGTKYHPKDFTFTISEWGGPGGRARGTFSGEMRSEGSNLSLTIESGSFDAHIQ